MTATEIRNTNFETLRATLAERRADVYRACATFGPATTLALAERSGIGLLTLRPRMTELEQLGLVACVDHEVIGSKSHGVYAVRSAEEWRVWRAETFPTDGQLQMGLNAVGALTR